MSTNQDSLAIRILQHRVIQLEDALGLVLRFHGGGPWTGADRQRWEKVTGTPEATTKVMCDHIRAKLAHTEVPA